MLRPSVLLLSLAFSSSHNCTQTELQTLPLDTLRERCGGTTLTKEVRSNGADTCMYAFDSNGCVFQLANLGSGFANATGQRLGCAPITHSYTWASSISPENNLAYAMGGRGSRRLYTMNMKTGSIVYQPAVGDNFDTAYFLAADRRNTGRLFGTWNDASTGQRIAEIDPQAGKVKKYFMDVSWSPVAGASCVPSCGLSTNCGYFSLPDTSYVTSWSCSPSSSPNALVRVNVDTLSVNLVKWVGSYDYFIVNPTTGIAYVSTTAYSVSRINEPSGTLTTVISIPNQNVVLFDLVVTTNGVCFPRAKDTKFGRAHPQDEDFICFNEGDKNVPASTQVYSVPYLSQYDMPYVTASAMGPC